MEIIGVVGDVKYSGLDQENAPVYYQSSDQATNRPMWLLVRTRGDAHSMIAAVRKEAAALDPGSPIDHPGTMAEAFSESVSLPRVRSLLMSAFAAAALLLAAIGIYGVIAYSVAQRTQEIGIRMALGATRSGVLRLIIIQSGRLAAIGIAIGVAGAFDLTSFLKKMLFGVTPSDALTFVGAVSVLGVVAILAGLAPAL